ncbi:MAG TPA: 3,4-dihydroxy-2-butanone-4-phosphate synthase [Acidimicrobiales bacterium]
MTALDLPLAGPPAATGPAALATAPGADPSTSPDALAPAHDPGRIGPAAPLDPADLGSGPVARAVAAVRRGGFAVLVDDDGTGALVLAAQATTPEKVAFLVRHSTGVVRVALDGARLDALLLPPMVPGAPDGLTVSVDARHGTGAGTSAADRCLTVHALVDPGTKPDDLTRPGNVFPQRTDARGVLGRAGRGEAAVDLTRLAGSRQPGGVVADLVDDDGALLAGAALARFAERHRLPVVAVADLVRHRHEHEKLVRRVAAARVPTPQGDYTALVYESLLDGSEHVAFVLGDVDALPGRPGVPVHVHVECLTGDLFGSLRCDCRRRLDAARRRLAAAGAGVLVYLRRHDHHRGGSVPELLHPELHQDRSRHGGVAAQILADLGVATSPARASSAG